VLFVPSGVEGPAFVFGSCSCLSQPYRAGSIITKSGSFEGPQTIKPPALPEDTYSAFSLRGPKLSGEVVWSEDDPRRRTFEKRIPLPPPRIFLLAWNEKLVENVGARDVYLHRTIFNASFEANPCTVQRCSRASVKYVSGVFCPPVIHRSQPSLRSHACLQSESSFPSLK